jgi:hypothetical protein
VLIAGNEQEPFPAHIGEPDIVVVAGLDGARLVVRVDDVAADLGEREAEGEGVLVDEEPRRDAVETAQPASLRSFRPLS